MVYDRARYLAYIGLAHLFLIFFIDIFALIPGLLGFTFTNTNNDPYETDLIEIYLDYCIRFM